MQNDGDREQQERAAPRGRKGDSSLTTRGAVPGHDRPVWWQQPRLVRSPVPPRNSVVMSRVQNQARSVRWGEMGKTPGRAQANRQRGPGKDRGLREFTEPTCPADTRPTDVIPGQIVSNQDELAVYFALWLSKHFSLVQNFLACPSYDYSNSIY